MPVARSQRGRRERSTARAGKAEPEPDRPVLTELRVAPHPLNELRRVGERADAPIEGEIERVEGDTELVQH